MRAAAERAALDATPPLPAPLPGRRFWIGAWCSPPARATRPSAYDSLAQAGIEVAVVPLEDRYRRADNLARLALLEQRASGGAAAPVPPLLSFVRDDSVHWDEGTRPGWEARVERAVAAYRDRPALAGIMLADEPGAGQLATWAPLARRIRRLDPAHPVYVNFLGLPADAPAAADARWRDDLARALGEGELAFFTVDAYPFRRGGEAANFLRTLEAAAAVSRATRRPWGAVLQLTGHGALLPATPAQMRYQALEALAHGATGLVWFTYWTPQPAEAPWFWRDGAVEYATGAATAQFAPLARANALARRVAAFLDGRPTLVSHVGGGLPAGSTAGAPPAAARPVPGLLGADGAPLTLAFTRADRDPGRPSTRRLLVVNRDLAAARTVHLHFDPGVTRAEVVTFEGNDPGEAGRRDVPVPVPAPFAATLAAAGAIGLVLHFD
jgi:hypothetical protein